MSILAILPILILSAIVSALFIRLLTPVANAAGLVDKPDARKQHVGAVPLVGGVAIFLTLAIGFSLVALFVPEQLLGADFLLPVAAGGALMVITGIFDDQYNLGVARRTLLTFAAALIFAVGYGLPPVELGDLFGTGHLWVASGFMTCLFAAICIFGIVNAFNMLDGHDGVLGLQLCVGILTFHIVVRAPLRLEEAMVLGAVIGFLVSNLGLLSAVPRSFMGDSGSMFLGFIVAAFLLAAPLKDQFTLQPVTALYLVGLPLVDMVSVAVRRLAQRRSPFAPGSDHIHHLFTAAGFSSRQTLLCVTLLGSIYPAIGGYFHLQGTSVSVQFWIIFGLGFVHLYATSRLFHRIAV